MSKKGERGTAIYAFSPAGADLGVRLQGLLPAGLFLPASLRQAGNWKATYFNSLPGLLRALFHARERHVFIGAAGIAVRAIAPLLVSKAEDPAVLVLDQGGRFVISLLSGHLGGANAFAVEVAAALGAAPVITTATDNASLPALDLLAKERGLAIVNPVGVKEVSAALLQGVLAHLVDEDDVLGLADSPYFLPCPAKTGVPPAPGVLVSARLWTSLPKGVLLLAPPSLHLGVGCRRGASGEEIAAFIRAALSAAGLNPAAAASLSSVDLKRDEPGLTQAAQILGLPLHFFAARELEAWPGISAPGASARLLGLDSVCESAALAGAALYMARQAVPCVREGAGQAEEPAASPRLILPKRKNSRITLAAASLRDIQAEHVFVVDGA